MIVYVGIGFGEYDPSCAFDDERDASTWAKNTGGRYLAIRLIEWDCSKRENIDNFKTNGELTDEALENINAARPSSGGEKVSAADFPK